MSGKISPDTLVKKFDGTTATIDKISFATLGVSSSMRLEGVDAGVDLTVANWNNGNSVTYPLSRRQIQTNGWYDVTTVINGTNVTIRCNSEVKYYKYSVGWITVGSLAVNDYVLTNTYNSGHGSYFHQITAKDFTFFTQNYQCEVYFGENATNWPPDTKENFYAGYSSGKAVLIKTPYH